MHQLIQMPVYHHHHHHHQEAVILIIMQVVCIQIDQVMICMYTIVCLYIVCIQLYVYIGGNSDKKSGGGGDKKSNGGGNRGSSWKITEISIISTLLLLVSCYLYLQQISHRIILVNIAVKIQNYG
eukprot:500903_1